MRAGVVVNPVAGGGRMRTLWPSIRDALAKHFGTIEVAETRRSGEACGLARGLAMDGCDLVVAAGGDGTISETVDGLMHARFATGHATSLGIFPVGTGSDLARGLGIDGDTEAVVSRMAGSAGRLIDAGRVDFIADDGALASRHFINIASLGVSGPTDRAVNAAKSSKARAGKATFLWHTVRELIRYRFQEVRITVDDQPLVEGRIAVVAIANGRYFGGGMMIAPDAKPDDGLFEVVVVHGRTKLKLLADLRLVYSGAHRDHGSCTFLRGRRIVVEPLGDATANAALLDIDGESPGRIPATFTALPGAVTVKW